jgi:general secretion pathway protein B
MSYILEALKKADQERDIGAVPNLATPSEARRPPKRSWRWLWVVAVLLVVNVILVAMLLRDRDAEVSVAEQAAPELPVTGRVQPAQPQAAAGAAVVDEALVLERSPLPENEPLLPGGGLVVLPERTKTQASSPSSSAQELSVTRTETSSTENDISQLPNWYELPLEFRNRLRLPQLDLHVYSEEPQNRFILVNFKKYREGERLESGLVLEEIYPEGMVMSYQGKRFLVDK